MHTPGIFYKMNVFTVSTDIAYFYVYITDLSLLMTMFSMIFHTKHGVSSSVSCYRFKSQMYVNVYHELVNVAQMHQINNTTDGVL